ncbi:DUF4148 domain-containing protein [Paraburkholderia sp. SOS3]|jgi:hypothetical protein|uniref:DUF4148 domain-containing protein n=1 Tax=Paraburkholderia sp. SOS3 TaxID=1926494 RepID=UPI0009473B4B|nr:DUF4148 domain-containing protein [Paraburkholderia sp. SOS3]APR39862.1 hypothetical protein BTO02_32350 [Paraburkholderia sp. SOS3]
MKRSLFAVLALTVLASTSAFAQGGGGIGRAGTYQQQWWSNGSTVTRAQVKAEIAASHGYAIQNADAGNGARVADQNGNGANRVSDQ